MGLGRCSFLPRLPREPCGQQQGQWGQNPGASRGPAGSQVKGAWAQSCFLRWLPWSPWGAVMWRPGISSSRGLGPPTVSPRWPPGLACEARGAVVSKPPAAGRRCSPWHMARPVEGAAGQTWGRAWACPWERAPGPAAPSLDRAMRPAARRGSAVHSRHGGQWAVRRGLAGPGSSRVGGPHRLASRTLSWTPVFPDSCNSVLGRLGPSPTSPVPRCSGVGGGRGWEKALATQTLREEGH